MFHYWIQKYDYSVTETKEVSLQEAIQAFHQVDWEQELYAFHHDEPEEGKNCPPGIGFHTGFDVDPSATLLHICPIDDAQVMFTFHYPYTKKVLWLFPRQYRKVHAVASYPIDQVDALIELFFQQADNEIQSIPTR